MYTPDVAWVSGSSDQVWSKSPKAFGRRSRKTWCWKGRGEGEGELDGTDVLQEARVCLHVNMFA